MQDMVGHHMDDSDRVSYIFSYYCCTMIGTCTTILTRYKSVECNLMHVFKKMTFKSSSFSSAHFASKFADAQNTLLEEL